MTVVLFIISTAALLLVAAQLHRSRVVQVARVEVQKIDRMRQ